MSHNKPPRLPCDRAGQRLVGAREESAVDELGSRGLRKRLPYGWPETNAATAFLPLALSAAAMRPMTVPGRWPVAKRFS